MSGTNWHVVEGTPPEPHLAGILELNRILFEGADDEAVRRRMVERHAALTVYAMEGEQVVGFKLGNERKPGCYYSWLGGVHVDHRRRGIARRLLELQHTWCRERGYARVRTRTKNEWRGMLLLNIQSGFDVIGAYTDEHGEPKLILERTL